ncbi:hypothetical protein N7528_005042 [Penicillium herquei]|nr:hypothetical protein N7528_005042 [Penicillium herquei]
MGFEASPEVAGNVASAAAIRCRRILTSASPDGLHHLEPKSSETLCGRRSIESSTSPDAAPLGRNTATKVIAAVFAAPKFWKQNRVIFVNTKAVHKGEREKSRARVRVSGRQPPEDLSRAAGNVEAD